MTEENEDGEDTRDEVGGELVAVSGAGNSVEMLYEAADLELARIFQDVVNNLSKNITENHHIPSLMRLVEFANKVRTKEYVEPEEYQSFAEMLMESFAAGEKEADLETGVREIVGDVLPPLRPSGGKDGVAKKKAAG